MHVPYGLLNLLIETVEYRQVSRSRRVPISPSRSAASGRSPLAFSTRFQALSENSPGPPSNPIARTEGSLHHLGKYWVARF